MSEFIFLKTHLTAIPGEITILFLTKVWKCLAKLMHLNPSDHWKSQRGVQNLEVRSSDLYSAIFPTSFYRYWYWGIWGLIKETDMTMRWQQYTTSFIWAVLWQVCMGKVPHSRRPSGGNWWGLLPRRGRGQTEVLGKRVKEGVMSLDDFTQQHNGISGSESSEGQQKLAVFYSHRVYLTYGSQILGTVLCIMQGRKAVNG